MTDNTNIESGYLPAPRSPADIENINYSINEPDQISSLSDDPFYTQHIHETQQFDQNLRPIE